MVRTYTAQDIVGIGDFSFEVEGSKIEGLTCQIEVNYGSRGMIEYVDLWAEFNPGQKQQVQALYDIIKSAVSRVIL